MRTGIKIAGIDDVRDKLEWKPIFLQYHASNKDFGAVFDILSSLSSLGSLQFLPLSPVEFTVNMTQSKGEVEKLFELWKEMGDRKEKRQVFRVACAFVEQALKFKQYDIGVKACEIVRGLGIDMKAQITITAKLLTGIMKDKEVEIAEEFIKQFAIKPTAPLCNQFIEIYADRWDLEKVVTWIEVMNSVGGKPNEYTLSCLISAAVNNNCYEMVKFFVDEMAKVHVKPSISHFSAILSKLAISGDTEKIEGLLRELGRCTDIQLSDKAFKIVVGTALQQGDIPKSEMYRLLFKKWGLKPSLDSYKPIIVRAGLNFEIDGILHWIGACKAEGLQLENDFYTRLLEEQLRHGSESSLELGEKLIVEHGMVPSSNTCSFAVTVATKVSSKHQIRKWMKLIQDNKYEIDVRAYGSLIARACEDEEYALVEQWMTKMREDNVAPNVTIFNRLIHAASMKGDSEGIVKYMREMREAGIQADASTYASLINNAAKLGQSKRVLEYIKVMKQQGLLPNSYSFAPVLLLAAERGDEDFWLAEMDNNEIARDMVVYTSLMKGAAQGKNLKRVLQWFNEMQDKMIKATIAHYTIIADCAVEVGEIEKGIEWVRKMEEFPKPAFKLLAKYMKAINAQKKRIDEKVFLDIAKTNVQRSCDILLVACRK